MQHAFSGFGLSDAFGLNDTNSTDDDLIIPVQVPGQTVEVPVTLHVWQAPNRNRLLVSLYFRCPQCDCPLNIPASQVGVTLNEQAPDGAAAFELRTPIECPGHWESVNEYGHAAGRQTRCGWMGMVRSGKFHHPRCPSSNFNQPVTNCNCARIYENNL